MDFIELIFALLAKFVPLDSVKLQRLESDGKIKEIGEQWYAQVAMAISFIFLQRVIFDFLNPSDDEDEDDE